MQAVALQHASPRSPVQASITSPSSSRSWRCRRRYRRTASGYTNNNNRLPPVGCLECHEIFEGAAGRVNANLRDVPQQHDFRGRCHPARQPDVVNYLTATVILTVGMISTYRK
jgi:hypothetical protein